MLDFNGDELQGDWTRTDRWQFQSLGDGRWRVRMTILSSRQDKPGDISGGNSTGQTFEETYSTVDEGGGRFRLIVPDGKGGMTKCQARIANHNSRSRILMAAFSTPTKGAGESGRAPSLTALRRTNINLALPDEFLYLSAVSQDVHDGVLQQSIRVIECAPTCLDDD